MNQRDHRGGSAPDLAVRASGDLRRGTPTAEARFFVCAGPTLGLVGADPGSGSLER
jgi:hypothetical protein